MAGHIIYKMPTYLRTRSIRRSQFNALKRRRAYQSRAYKSGSGRNMQYFQNWSTPISGPPGIKTIKNISKIRAPRIRTGSKLGNFVKGAGNMLGPMGMIGAQLVGTLLDNILEGDGPKRRKTEAGGLLNIGGGLKKFETTYMLKNYNGDIPITNFIKYGRFLRLADGNGGFTFYNHSYTKKQVGYHYHIQALRFSPAGRAIPNIWRRHKETANIVDYHPNNEVCVNYPVTKAYYPVIEEVNNMKFYWKIMFRFYNPNSMPMRIRIFYFREPYEESLSFNNLASADESFGKTGIATTYLAEQPINTTFHPTGIKPTPFPEWKEVYQDILLSEHLNPIEQYTLRDNQIFNKISPKLKVKVRQFQMDPGEARSIMFSYKGFWNIGTNITYIQREANTNINRRVMMIQAWIPKSAGKFDGHGTGFETTDVTAQLKVAPPVVTLRDKCAIKIYPGEDIEARSPALTYTVCPEYNPQGVVEIMPVPSDQQIVKTENR